MSFNIFTTLSKDNKELTHSAFLKFLLLEDKVFAKKLFNVDVKLEEDQIKLEEKLNKNLRADLKIDAPDLKLVVENKFKCLPQEGQLRSYSEALKNNGYHKYLLYFQSGSNFKLPSDWLYITYNDVNNVIKEYLKTPNLPTDKEIFLRHYQEFLQDYIDAYKQIMSNSAQMKSVFKNEFTYNGKFRNDNNYWLKLIFHELAVKIQQQCKFDVYVGAGSSYKPLINIQRPDWKYKEGEEEYAFVVQLNGSNLKYYAHLKNATKRQGIIDSEVETLKANSFLKGKSGEFKKKLSKNSTTGFIYREKLTDELDEDQFTIAGITKYIAKFIERIEEARLVEIE